MNETNSDSQNTLTIKLESNSYIFTWKGMSRREMEIEIIHRNLQLKLQLHG